jgi:hypothetical protein
MITTISEDKYNKKTFIIDEDADVADLPTDASNMGSTAFSIDSKKVFILNGKNSWIEI